jgi:four helix bundle protein
VARQLARCGTSVGANVEEAQGAHSRRDFARRMNNARTEAREALYWLRLIAETRLVEPAKLSGIVEEADEILRILVAIVKKLKQVGGEEDV